MDNHLRVAYASDDGYVSFTGISMYSLFDNNRDFEEITVYILDNGISDEGKSALINISDEFQRDIVFLDCSDIEEWLGAEVVEMFKTQPTNVPITSYARLFLPELIDDAIEKILYLDADSMVVGNYQKLWNTDNSAYAVMGVLDNVTSAARKNVGLPEDFGYINAGMLLMNLDYLRKIDFSSLVKEFIRKYNGRVYHHDQGVINGVLNKKIGILPPEYNMLTFFYEHSTSKETVMLYNIPFFYSEEEYNSAKSNPVFIHFTEGYLQRPWVNNCKHPLREEWIKYSKKTQWGDINLYPDKRSIKLKLLAWMNLNLPVSLTKSIIGILAK